MTKRVVLCILDGWGIAPPSPGNVIVNVNPPTYRQLIQNYPNSSLEASGVAVGLPANQDGNSETGHLNIGAGRIVYQSLARINMSIADGSFFTNQALLSAIKHVKAHKSALHLLGLIGQSGVHAYNDHLYALLLLAQKHNLSPVYLHLITDGRDSPPKDAINQIKQVAIHIQQFRTGQIVSLMGRYYAMDRDMRLDRTQQAFNCLTQADSSPHFDQVDQAINQSYFANITDEFIKPVTIGPNPQVSRIKNNDALIFYNFRIDRPRQLTYTLLNSQLKDFLFITMTRYHRNFATPVAFPEEKVSRTLGEVISLANLHQLRAAESEKERFVTYYFNGQREEPFAGEDRLIIPSPKIATYDLKPEMSTPELIKNFSRNFSSQPYALGVLNIACPDMVAHTGDMQKTSQAIIAADKALDQLIKLVDQTQSWLVITADHGNAEELINLKSQQTDTEHSLFPVPFIIYHQQLKQMQTQNGTLADVAPTILYLLELKQPQEMTGHNLIVYNKEKA